MQQSKAFKILQQGLNEIVGLIDFFAEIQPVVFTSQGDQHPRVVDLVQQLLPVV